MSKMQDELREWIKTFHSGRIWLTRLESELTVDSYLPLFKRFCEACGKNPDELIELKMNGMRAVGTDREFQAEENFDITINELDATESAKSNISTSILSFYKHNRRPLVEPKKFERPEPEKRRPSVTDIEEMANNLSWKRDKALLWFTASAPFREGTLEQLTWGDLKETGDSEAPVRITVKARRLKGKGKGKYRGIEQTSFLHKYAFELMSEYYKEATRKLRKKYPDFKITDKTPIFLNYVNGKTAKGLGRHGIREVWESASLNAWGNLEEKRFSPHDMRDFVSNALKKAKVDPVDRAVLTGHKIKGVEKHYQDPEKIDLREAFKTALPYLTTQKPEELRKDIKTLSEELDKERDDRALDTMRILRTTAEMLKKAGLKVKVEENLTEKEKQKLEEKS